MALPAPAPTSTALITGASAGIGTEFARQLAARGHNVFLVARREDRLGELAAEIERDHGVVAKFASCDVGDAAARAELFKQIRDQDLAVEILVNNAGFSTIGDVHKNPDRQLGMIQVNVEALVDFTDAFLPAMTERGQGAVIQVASTASFQPIPVQATYAATKAFVRSFSEAVSAELKGTGVTMTALCPGPVATEFADAAGFKKGNNTGPGFIWASPEDVAKAGIHGAEKGKRTVVHGIGNRAMATAAHHSPQSIVLGPMASLYRRVVGE